VRHRRRARKQPFPPELIIICKTVKTRLGLIVVGALTIGAGYLYHAVKLEKYSVTTPIVGFVVVIAGVAIMAIGIRRWLEGSAGLIIDQEGIVPNPRRPAERVLWSDLRGAHLAVVEIQVPPYAVPPRRLPIVALELVDPAGFYRRWDAGRRPWLGYDTAVRPDYFPIYHAGLNTDASRLMNIIKEGIARQGHLAPDGSPQRTYQLFFP
jgi:hypothetical protein